MARAETGLSLFDIYERVAEDVQSSGCEALLEPSAMINQCCVSLSKKSLSELGDDDFAATLYFKLLDRPPRIQDIRSVANRLSTGKTTREDEITRFMESEEYRIKNVKVRLVP